MWLAPEPNLGRLMIKQLGTLTTLLWLVSCAALSFAVQAQAAVLTVAQTSSKTDTSADSQSGATADTQTDGAHWFAKMQQALRQLNFDASFVHARGERIEPYRWLHGVSDSGVEIELLAGMNGPEYRALRHNDLVSYYHALGSPYTMRATIVDGPVPNGFFQPLKRINSAYHVISVGGDRIMDRPAQHIRVVARDRQRYGYSVWVDRESGMLLRSATLSMDGDVLEQIQLTSLFVSEQFNENLQELKNVARPPVIDDRSNSRPLQGSWTVGWLPEGFNLLRSNSHRMAVTGQTADYFLYSDGLAKVSVYISRHTDATQAMQIEGAESLYSVRLEGHQVTVVGALPLATVQRIAQSVRAGGSSR